MNLISSLKKIFGCKEIKVIENDLTPMFSLKTYKLKIIGSPPLVFDGSIVAIGPKQDYRTHFYQCGIFIDKNGKYIAIESSSSPFNDENTTFEISNIIIGSKLSIAKEALYRLNESGYGCDFYDWVYQQFITPEYL